MGTELLVNHTVDVSICFEFQNVSNVTGATASCVSCKPFFVWALATCVMCGNLLVIMSIVYFRQLHTPTNYLVLSLAVTDWLVGALILPFTAVLIVSPCSHLQDVLCKVRRVLDVVLCTSSILNLCCISIDRYYAVCQPLRYRRKISAHVTVVMIFLTWTVSALNGILVSVQTQKQGTSGSRCALLQHSNSIMGVVFSFYIPAVVMFYIYTRIFLVAQKQLRRIHNTKCGATVSKSERKATKTLAVVMGAFLACWTPFFLCVTLLSLNRPIPNPVTETFKWFGWSNSMFNPLIYAFFYSWFRSAFTFIFTGKIFQGDFRNVKL